MANIEQYLFEVNVTIWTGSGILKYRQNTNIDSAHINFSIPFTDTSDPSVGEIIIYNMLPGNFSRIKAGDRVLLIAGFHGDIGTVIDGHIYNTTTPTKDGGDVRYVLRVIDGTDYRRKGHMSKTFAKGTMIGTAINQIANSAGIVLNLISLSNNSALKDGYTVDGSPIDAIADLVDQGKSSIYYAAGKLTVRYLHDGFGAPSFDLNNATGLLESPQMERRDEDWLETDDNDKKGRYVYNVTSILNYRFTTNGYVHLHSKFTNVNATIMSGEHSFDGDSPQTSLELVTK